MIRQNSGKIYLVPLQFSMGFVLAKTMDYTDESPFDGLLTSVLAFHSKSNKEVPNLEEIKEFKILFAPVPLNKWPNIKGKGAWKYIGQLTTFDDPAPVFKSTVELVKMYNAKDWSQIDKWYKSGFSGDVQFVPNYEEVRGLESRTLYSMENISIRATMFFLIQDNKKISDFFDLANERFRRLYLELINTSFEKNIADQLIKEYADHY